MSKRTTTNQLTRARRQIDTVTSEQDWRNAWRSLFQLIQNTDDPRAKVMAMRLICEYRFNKPYLNMGDTEGDVPATFYDPSDGPP